MSFPAYFQFQSVRKSIHHRDPDPVQAAGHLVGGPIELAAGMQDRHDNFRGGHILSGVHINRYAAAIVLYGHGTIQMDDDINFVTIAPQRLIDGIVHHFINEMMQTQAARRADIHGRSFSYCR